MTEFGGLNHGPGKRVLNNLKTICLRFWKVLIQRVAVIKLRVNNRCGNDFLEKLYVFFTNSTRRHQVLTDALKAFRRFFDPEARHDDSVRGPVELTQQKL